MKRFTFLIVTLLVLFSVSRAATFVATDSMPNSVLAGASGSTNQAVLQILLMGWSDSYVGGELEVVNQGNTYTSVSWDLDGGNPVGDTAYKTLVTKFKVFDGNHLGDYPKVLFQAFTENSSTIYNAGWCSAGIRVDSRGNTPIVKITSKTTSR